MSSFNKQKQLETRDENVTVGVDQTILDFQGDGVSVSSSGTKTTVIVTGDGGVASSFSGTSQIFTGSTGVNSTIFPDNLAEALWFGEAANRYLRFVSTDSAEAVACDKGFGTSTLAAVTSVGSTQGTATLLTAQNSYITSGATGTSVRLPPSRPAGEFWTIYYATVSSPGAGLSNLINVFPSSGETILPNAVNVRDLVSGGNSATYLSLGSGQWRNIAGKSDHVNRVVGDFWNFYGVAGFFNGLSVSVGGSFSVATGVPSTLAGNFGVTQFTIQTTAGTTITLNWSNGASQAVDLQGASGDVTLTLSNPISGGQYSIKATQGSVARNLIWPATVKWPGGVAPTISAANDAMDFIRLYWDGTNYLATFAQAFA